MLLPVALGSDLMVGIDPDTRASDSRKPFKLSQREKKCVPSVPLSRGLPFKVMSVKFGVDSIEKSGIVPENPIFEMEATLCMNCAS